MLLFEDNPETPSSVLLSHVLKDSVYFTGGNELLLYFCKRFSMTETTYVFPDVVPDNKETKSLYWRLREYAVTQTNVHVIPIPCIEFYILLMFDVLNVARQSRDFLSFTQAVNGQPIVYPEPSFERFCKRILNNQRACIRNIASKQNPVLGTFYRNACPCAGAEQVRCEQDVTQDLKAYTLVQLTLNCPTVFNSKDEILKYIRDNLESILEHSLATYEKVMSALNK